MSALYLIRHSLTEANERRLYGGSTDLPLTEAGRALALDRRGAVPPCDVRVTSGMRRADETLAFMMEKKPDLVMAGLREMDFGAFEMKGYDELRRDEAYLRWIGDETGQVRCPGGESAAQFGARVLAAGAALLALPGDVLAVCHGGVIVRLMQAWFPGEGRNFYQWQPGPCRGYRIAVEGGAPTGFQEV